LPTDPRQRADAALELVPVDPGRARQEAEEALSAARQAHDKAAAAQAERALGMLARLEHDMAAASTHLGTAARLAEQAGVTDIAAAARISRALALAYAGRMPAAHRELDRAATLAGVDIGKLEFQRAALLQMQGRLDEAEARYTVAEPAVRRAGDVHRLAMLHNNRGIVRCRTGSLPAAEADLRQAVALHRDLEHRDAAVEAMHNLGLVEAKRGDLLSALATFDEVDREREALGGTDAVGLLDRADVLLAGRLLAEARATAERAVSELERAGLSAYAAEARLVLARVALAEGHHAEAADLAEQSAGDFAQQRRPSYQAFACEVRVHAEWLAGVRTPALLAESRRAAAALARSGWAVAAADARLIAAQVALSLGRPGVARAQLAGLLGARRNDPAEIRSRALQARALLRLSSGDRSGAAAALRTAVDLLDRQRRALGGTELRAHASAHAAEAGALGLRLALEDGAPARVLRWAERLRAGALAVRAVRPPENSELADALAEFRAVAHLASQPGSPSRPADVATRQARLEATVRRLARSTGIMNRYEPAPISITRLQERLEDRIMVELIDDAGELYALVLTGRHRTLHRVGRTLALTRLVATLRYWLRRILARQGSPAQLDRAAQEMTLAAKELDGALLGVLPARLADRPLVVVPTKALHTLPWQVLPRCAGRPVSVAPSASWWLHTADRSGRSAAATAPVVLVSGPDLPRGAAEIDDLSTLYPSARRLTGASATASAVAKALDGAGLAHIAAHGRFRSDQPLLSELRLIDGPLTVYDLESLTDAPRTIVLASCDAGLSKVLPGDELMGLAACLLAQGTVTLLAPLLPVPDADVHPVTVALHRRLHQGEQPAVAVAAVNDELAGTPFAYTAAAFTCIGG
jgi:CHAT domain-containing protein